MPIKPHGFEPTTLTEQQLAKFWAKVEKAGPDDCWLWTGGISGPGKNKNAGGYGRFKVERIDMQAHRISWVIANGKAVPKGEFVLHTCDNRKCVNPAHLFTGTHAHNMQDMHDKHRHPRRVPMKLNEVSAARIRKLRSEGWTYAQLVEEFGVCKATISYVANGKTWAESLK